MLWLFCESLSLCGNKGEATISTPDMFPPMPPHLCQTGKGSVPRRSSQARIAGSLSLEGPLIYLILPCYSLSLLLVTL